MRRSVALLILVVGAAAALASAGLPVLTQQCTSPASATQQFTSTCGANGACTYESASSTGMCITSTGQELGPLSLAACGGANQSFTPQANGGVAAADSSGLCWNVDGGAAEPAGTPIILFACGSVEDIQPNDIFTFLPQNQIYANGSSLCLDVSPPPHDWIWVPGQLIGPDALPSAVMALPDAEALCLKTPACYGVTYNGPLNPANNQTIFFKTATQPTPTAGWQTFLGCGVITPC